MTSPDPFLYCAIDGGGTGCRALLARADGTVVNRAEGGPANYTSDPEGAVAAVRAVWHTVTGQESPVATHIGLAGIMDTGDEQEMAARLALPGCRVSDDRVTTANGALGVRDGAVLALGTGGFTAIRQNGALRFFGGWGLILGDEGSGAWLGRGLLSAVLLARDGLVPQSDLIETTLATFGTPSDIVAFGARAVPRDYATLAPSVIAAAATGDGTGRDLMARGAAYLERTIDAANLAPGDVVCLTGGVGPHYAAYLSPETARRIVPPSGDALDGALALAVR